MTAKTHSLLIASLCTATLAISACQPNSTEKAETPATTSSDSGTQADQPSHDQHTMATDSDNEVTQAYMQGMSEMHDEMMTGMQANDADVAFAKGMLPHHKGAVDMAEVELKYGKDETMRQLAEDIIEAQKAEIEQMQQWIAEHPDSEAQDYTQAMQKDYQQSMQAMNEDMMSGIQHSDPDMAFAKGMLPHHQGAVAMAEVQLKYGKDNAMRKLAEDIIQAQKSEIDLMQKWITEHS